MKNKKAVKQKFISWLRQRIKLLESARQHYGQNPNLMRTLEIANQELVQNDIDALKKILNAITQDLAIP